MKIMNVAAYKFVALKKLPPDLQRTLCDKGILCQLKGRILLSFEGVNLILVGGA